MIQRYVQFLSLHRMKYIAVIETIEKNMKFDIHIDRVMTQMSQW